MRELLKYLDRSLRYTSCSSDTEDHWGEGAGHATLADVVRESGKCILHVIVLEVHVGASNQERCLELSLKEVLTDASKEVKGASDTSVAAKRYKSLLEILTFDWGLTDTLEVHHANIELSKLV